MNENKDFLPNDYEIPAGGSRYMKFEVGPNKFRILDSPILGYEAWNEVTGEDGKPQRKPIRFRMDQQIPKTELDEPDKIKHFWALPIYNYQTKRIEILEITQKTIQRVLKSLAKNEDWGDPRLYDITVVRTGEGLETEYETLPSPHRPIDEAITKEYVDMYLNLEALYDGDDPFTEKATTADEKFNKATEELEEVDIPFDQER